MMPAEPGPERSLARFGAGGRADAYQEVSLTGGGLELWRVGSVDPFQHRVRIEANVRPGPNRVGGAWSMFQLHFRR